MASSSTTNPTYNIPSFNGHDRLVALHQEITDFLHYQSHVQFAATASLPPHTAAANKQEQETIIEFLKEERARIRTLKHLLEMVDDNAAALHSLYEDSPVDPNINWGEIAWGPTPQWEQLPPPPQE